MRLANTTILIVEDESHDVEFLRRAFLRVGVKNPVHAVENGEEAIAYLDGTGRFTDRAVYPFPHVIITDLKMPHLGGLELLHWLHAHPKCRVVPTIVFTSSTSQADVDAAFAAGASGYMVKPVDFRELESTVKIIADYWRLSLIPTIGPE
jgi:CheY-like chemotaxis protein